MNITQPNHIYINIWKRNKLMIYAHHGVTLCRSFKIAVELEGRTPLSVLYQVMGRFPLSIFYHVFAVWRHDYYGEAGGLST